MINIVGVEFLINFGGLGQLINELAERYDLPGTYGAICFVILASIVFFDRHRTDRAMAAAGHLTRAPAAAGRLRIAPVRGSRSSLVLTSRVAWEALAASGLLFRDVVPSLARSRGAVRAADAPT